MPHLDAAELHEYLDRGAVDDKMIGVAEHLSECDVCSAALHDVEAERRAASSILRAAAPLQRPVPLFETLVPRPRYETFDTPVPTDMSFPQEHGQFRQASVGLRGQAIMFVWAATIMLLLGMGWLVHSMYRMNEERTAGIAASRALYPTSWTAITTDSANALLGGTALAVQNAEIVDYSIGAAGSDVKIRVRQVTHLRDTIEVVQPIPSPGATTAQANGSAAPAESRGVLADDRFFRTTQSEGTTVMIVTAKEWLLNASKLSRVQIGK